MSRFAPLVPLLILASLFLILRPVPAEDACILFRYATHVAEGHGIVWNVGEPPVEGATEFAWMVLLAAMMRAGLPLQVTAQALGLLLSALGALLLYASSRRLFGTGPLTACAVSSAYAASTTVLHAGTGFGTPLYTLLVLAAFVLAYRLLTDDAPADMIEWLLPVMLLLTGLARPEGIPFGALLYAAILAGRPAVFTRRFLVRQLVFLGIPGALYYGWRYDYFGYPFPNTYYVKLADGSFNMESARRIARFAIRFCLIPSALIVFWIVTLKPPARRRIALLAGVPLACMCLYLRFAMIQDLGYRFLFPSFAALLLLAAPAMAAIPGRVVRGLLGMLLVAASLWMIRGSGYRGGYDDRHQIGRRLAAFDPRGHVMMPTEAGYLPYLSGWTTVDPLGLNDVVVAHQGLTVEYIATRSPDLIMFHVDTPTYRDRWAPPGADRWEAMTKTLYAYALEHGYRLVSVIPKSDRVTDGYHWYYIRPGMADEEAVTTAILEVAGTRGRDLR